MGFWKKIQKILPKSDAQKLYNQIWSIGEHLLVNVLKDSYAQEILEDNISHIFNVVKSKLDKDEVQYPKAFIERTWKNKRVDFYRQLERNKKFLEKLIQKETQPKEEVAPTPSPAYRDDFVRVLYKEAGLSKKRTEVMLLREIHEYTHEEISAQLDISLSSSQQLYKNGRHQFQHWLINQVGITEATYQIILLAQQRSKTWAQIHQTYQFKYSGNLSCEELESTYQVAYRKLRRWLHLRKQTSQHKGNVRVSSSS
ncbi:MAG: hypothetical protein MK212_08580 [Saprospiraceae bacterium]|nr:hypothetical protein [Saprospiraceae bacterium]